MSKKFFTRISGFLILFLFISISASMECNASSDNQPIKVGYYQNDNFQEGASEGAVKSGYGYEYLRKISSINGWKYEYVYGSWNDIYNAFLAGELDILAGLGYSEDRLDVMYYPDYPMGYESYYLFARADDTSVTLDPKTLNGKRIGTIPGLLERALVNWLYDREVSAEIVVFDDVDERDKNLENGNIDAFIGEAASVNANGYIFPLVKISNADMYLCVTKSRKDLLDELNAALAEIDNNEPYYIYELSEKYFSVNAVSVNITREESNWLNSHNYVIKIGYMDDFLPYCGTDKNGNATGIMVDVVKASFANLRINGEVKFEFYPYKNTDEMIAALHNHEIELLFPVSNNIYYMEQNDLYNSKDVISSAMNFVYKGDVDDAKKLPLAINKNNQIQYDYTKTHFEEAKIIFFDSVEECLDAVALGNAGGAILSGLRASTLLRAPKYEALNYIELPYSTVKCFGISTMHKGILTLLNKALNTLDEEAAMTFTYKYIGHDSDYSVREFVRRHTFLVALVIVAFAVVVLTIVGIVIVKHQKEKIYYNFAYKDSLTKLHNRRAFEEDLAKYSSSIPDDLICVSMDLNGLKNVNDNLGHAAGDELISEAGRLIEETFGSHGRIYRTGGDEYFGLIKSSVELFDQLKSELEMKCESWRGEFSDTMRVSVGCATRYDFDEDGNIMEMCKLADKRMYEAKSEYYRANNIDRRRV